MRVSTVCAEPDLQPTPRAVTSLQSNTLCGIHQSSAQQFSSPASHNPSPNEAFASFFKCNSNGMKTGTTCSLSHSIARLVGSESGMIQRARPLHTCGESKHNNNNKKKIKTMQQNLGDILEAALDSNHIKEIKELDGNIRQDKRRLCRSGGAGGKHKVHDKQITNSPLYWKVGLCLSSLWKRRTL